MDFLNEVFAAAYKGDGVTLHYNQLGQREQPKIHRHNLVQPLAESVRLEVHIEVIRSGVPAPLVATSPDS